MNILETLVQLRDDIKTWVTNNLQALNTKIDEKTIPVDSELSETSANPVQNQVIVEALAGKQPAGDYALKSDVENIQVPNSNLVNGSAEGSLRSVGSMAEDSLYHIGDDAFAEGLETEASGACSHAEGIAAIAAGAFSHAEGRNAYAGGEASHAEGIYTYTEGDQSHAEGNTTHALGNRSHAEGYASVARGEASHAEGSSYAHNSRCHSEGTDTVAEGHHSHSEGAYTHAKGDSSHAEGCGMTVELEISGEANALTFQYVPFGYGRLYPGMTVHYYYSEMVYRHDDGDPSTYEHTYGVTRSTLATIVAVDEDAETITLDQPLSDVALEYEMVYAYMGGVAHGEASHSEGYSTIAAGLAQHAEGAYNIIDPQHDYNNNDARGKYIHIAGNGESDLIRSNAYALDWNGNAYYAGDVYVAGDGKNDFAGSKKLATEEFVTGAVNNFEIPNSNLVNGSTNGSLRSIGSAAESDEYTMGNNAFAEGIDTMANGPASHAEGYGTQALYQSAHAEGQQTSAAEMYTHAEGYWTRATGRISHAEGENTLASGRASHASGYHTIADGRSMTSIGECNLPSLESAYILQSSKITNQIIGTRTTKVTASNTEPIFSNLDGSRSWINSTRIDASSVQAGMYVEVGSNNYHIHVSSVSILGSMVQVSGTKYAPVDCGTSRSDIAFVVGNGFTEEPSNAHTLDWSGNGWFAGDVYVGSTSGTNKDEGSKKLATEDFVTAALAALGLPIPTAADAGKILRVNAEGKYELVALANAEEATF